MRTTSFKYMAIIAGLALLFTACSSPAPEATSESETEERITLTTEQFTSSGYQLGNLSKQVFETTVVANGSVDVPPKFRASVSAYFGGYVKQIDLLVGEKVQQGQVLFTLENPEFLEVQKSYLETMGELKYLKEDLARQGSLAEAHVSSQKKLTKAQSDFEMMEAKQAALRKKLEMMRVQVDGLTANNLQSAISITAPISGFVTEINASPGTFLSPADVAMKMVSTEHLHLKLKVFEKDAAKVAEGQTVHFRMQNEQDFRKGTIHLINKNLDPHSRTLTALAHISAASVKGLAVGSYIEAQIVTGADTVMALPSAAVVELEDTHFVLKVTATTDSTTEFEQVPVVVGATGNGFTSVLNTDGLTGSDQFLTVGAFDLILE